MLLEEVDDEVVLGHHLRVLAYKRHKLAVRAHVPAHPPGSASAGLTSFKPPLSLPPHPRAAWKCSRSLRHPCAWVRVRLETLYSGNGFAWALPAQLRPLLMHGQREALWSSPHLCRRILHAAASMIVELALELVAALNTAFHHTITHRHGLSLRPCRGATEPMMAAKSTAGMLTS